MRKLENSELNRKSIDDFKEASKTPLIIVLDDIRSLNNIGSVFRTSDAFLIEKIFLCGITATPPNKEIHKALQEAHIFAYPSIFQETCCLAMVEAGAAGCRLISTSLGALYETGSEYAVLMPLKQTFPEMVKDYAKLLNDEIDSYWSTLNQEKLKEQSDFFNKYYSWELRSKEWNNLFDKISST